ncbi:MAG: 3-dehydroquinate synthase [Clostridiales Family XIII bacterium]|jgi:3-dehydroquinate synthase|nr:3-dehydroquinate synthase [Clostridiales Family XIII bacterium]
MTAIRLGLGEKSYDVLIGRGLSGRLGELLRERVPDAAGSAAGGGGIAVVADGAAWGLHGGALAASMARAGLDFSAVTLEPGERGKSLEGLGALYSAFAAMGLRRGGLVIAFGGGVTGDLAGFAAATWMRGLPYAQVPTTLLAQVDSGIGGKTAINIDEGKNLVGAFRQPLLVASDTALLDTLPPREFRCGMAEVIKYGAIRSKSLFEAVKGPLPAERLEGVIGECCRIKGGIVERDELDTGERMLLNFGHTFGHAVEKLGGYSRHSHGEAVASGMALAAAIGERAGITRAGCADGLRGALRAQGLPDGCEYGPDELLPQLRLDKKSGGGGVCMAMIRDIGDSFLRQMGYGELEACCSGLWRADAGFG